MAPNAKFYQLLRAIGRKKCFLNSPNTLTHTNTLLEAAFDIVKIVLEPKEILGINQLKVL